MPDPLAVTMTADVLGGRQEPALSATSDMPDVSQTPPLSVEVNQSAPAPPAVAPGEDGEAAAADADPSPVDSAAAEPPKISESLSKLAKQRDEARTQAQERQAQIDRLAAIAEKLAADAAARAKVEEPPAEAKPTTFDEPRPRRQDFDDPDDFDAARDEWLIRRNNAQWEQRLVERDNAARAAVEKQASDAAAAKAAAEQAEIARTFHARVTEYKKDKPDFDAIFERKDIYVSVPMAQVITADEKGPAILDYFGEHPEESTRIAQMVVPGQFFPLGHPAAGEPVPDIVRQSYEMALIRHKIASPAAAPQPKPLPRPIDPVGNRNQSGPKSSDEMTMDEYAAMRNPQIQAQRRPNTIVGQRIN